MPTVPTLRDLLREYDDDGYLPDIEIDGVPIDVQARVYDGVRRRHACIASTSREPLPQAFERFLSDDQWGDALIIRVDRVEVCWHIDDTPGIWMDVDARGIRDAADEHAFSEFIAWLGDTTGQRVELFPEDAQDRSPIATYSPGADTGLVVVAPDRRGA